MGRSNRPTRMLRSTRRFAPILPSEGGVEVSISFTRPPMVCAEPASGSTSRRKSPGSDRAGICFRPRCTPLTACNTSLSQHLLVVGSSQIVTLELDTFYVESGGIGVLENVALNVELCAKPHIAQNAPHPRNVKVFSAPKHGFETIPSLFQFSEHTGWPRRDFRLLEQQTLSRRTWTRAPIANRQFPARSTCQ